MHPGARGKRARDLAIDHPRRDPKSTQERRESWRGTRRGGGGGGGGGRPRRGPDRDLRKKCPPQAQAAVAAVFNFSTPRRRLF